VRVSARRLVEVRDPEPALRSPRCRADNVKRGMHRVYPRANIAPGVKKVDALRESQDAERATLDGNGLLLEVRVTRLTYG
jgi:hypothetical protein